MARGEVSAGGEVVSFGDAAVDDEDYGVIATGDTEDEVAEEGGPGSGAAEDGTAQVGSTCR